MTVTINGTTGIDTVQDSSITSSKLSGIAGAVAWVNFNGTGTIAIRAAYNVSSLVDYQTGIYGVYYTNNLLDANMSIVSGAQSGTSAVGSLERNSNITYADETRFVIITGSTGGTVGDYDYIYAVVFR
jgi:hypothetical protein